MKKHILVSWIGHTDLWAMGQASADKKLMERIEEVIRKKPPVEPVGDGPVKTIVSNQHFEEVHFLSQWPGDLNGRFESWLGVETTIHEIKKDRVSDPTNYEQVFNASKAELESIRKCNEGGLLLRRSSSFGVFASKALGLHRFWILPLTGYLTGISFCIIFLGFYNVKSRKRGNNTGNHAYGKI